MTPQTTTHLSDGHNVTLLHVGERGGQVSSHVPVALLETAS